MFEVARSKVGKIILGDGSELTMRIAITEIREERYLPTGPDLGIGIHISLIVSKISNELKELVKDKPLWDEVQKTLITNLEKWERIKIVHVDEPFEEVVYKSSRNEMFKIIVKAKPVIISRTLHARDRNGNPVYLVRWNVVVEVLPQEER